MGAMVAVSGGGGGGSLVGKKKIWKKATGDQGGKVRKG